MESTIDEVLSNVSKHAMFWCGLNPTIEPFWTSVLHKKDTGKSEKQAGEEVQTQTDS